LYKVDEDPHETVNLADNPAYAAVRKRLHSELMRWMATQKDPGAAMDDPAVHAANRRAAKGSRK